MACLIDGFDHAIIGVADLEAARLAWRRLGFTLCPRGRHIGWGTANYCIMFPDDYLELLGIVDATQFVNNLDVFLADQGEGLLGMAFASSDVDALAEKLNGEPQDLKRLLELPEGTVEPRFKLVHPPRGILPGLSGFFCNHLTPELMRQPDWLLHANGARRIAYITIGVEDMAAAIDAYGRVFGTESVHQADGGAYVRTGIGEMRLIHSDHAPGLKELGVEVNDLTATEVFLKAAGISFSQSPDGLSIDPAEAAGAALAFI